MDPEFAIDTTIEEICKTVASAASAALSSASNATKPLTIDGSRRKFAQQILYSTKPDKKQQQKKAAKKEEAPVLQSTPSLASDHQHEEQQETVVADNTEIIEDKESRDTVSSPFRNVAFDCASDREKEDKSSSRLSIDGASDHHALMIEKRLSTSMCNDKEIREGVYQHIGKAPLTSKINDGSEMKLEELQRQASKDDCEACEVQPARPTMTHDKDNSPLDQLFRFVEKSVCGKISTQVPAPKEESSLGEGDPFDCECVVSDVQRSTSRKGATRVILQVKKVLKSANARGKNEEDPAFSSSPIHVLERDNSFIRELIADQCDEEQEKEGETQSKADTNDDQEEADDGREEPEPEAVHYESAKVLLSSRCRERLDDYRREKGRNAVAEESVKEIPNYSTKMTKKEIIDREKLRAQYL